MKRISRRSFLRASAATPVSRPVLASAAGTIAADGTSRRAFLQSGAGAAAGAAVILATPKVASLALEAGTSSTNTLAKPTTPSAPTPREPVTAYVRDASRGEVTVMSGKQETTYNDPVLVKRMLDAAR